MKPYNFNREGGGTNMKKMLSSKSFLTVMSILSVLLGFTILCGAALLVLERIGVVSFSLVEKEVTVSAGMESVSEDFPLYTKAPESAVGVGTEGLVPAELIEDTPFIDQYYLKLAVRSDMNEGAFAEGIYEIWRLGDKYRIHRYHILDNEVEYIIICDGKRVQIQDFTKASIVYEEYSAAYAFSEVAPVPNFRKLFADIHVFSFYQENESTCAFSCEYPVLGVVDHVEFVKSTGIVSRYRRLHGETTLLSVDMTAIDNGYAFVDYIFYFD